MKPLNSAILEIFSAIKILFRIKGDNNSTENTAGKFS